MMRGYCDSVLMEWNEWEVFKLKSWNQYLFYYSLISDESITVAFGQTQTGKSVHEVPFYKIRIENVEENGEASVR